MNKATEVMMQYVENLKRTYEKDHAELMEFKKLANQNSIRYGPSADTGGKTALHRNTQRITLFLKPVKEKYVDFIYASFLSSFAALLYMNIFIRALSTVTGIS